MLFVRENAKDAKRANAFYVNLICLRYLRYLRSSRTKKTSVFICGPNKPSRLCGEYLFICQCVDWME